MSRIAIIRKPFSKPSAISDIDHFKRFNDQHGHAVGDEVLKHVAKLFSASVRPDSEDLAFRYGGEEFCMLMPNTTPEEAMVVLENFRAKVASSGLQHGDNHLVVNVSIGLATSLLDGKDTKELFERADETLYACKHNGRNQIRYYAAGQKIRYQHEGMTDVLAQAYQAANGDLG